MQTFIYALRVVIGIGVGIAPLLLLLGALQVIHDRVKVVSSKGALTRGGLYLLAIMAFIPLEVAAAMFLR